MCYLLIDLSPLIYQLSIVDNRRGDNPMTKPNPSLQGYSGDSSRPFFAIYSKAAEEEDQKTVKRLQRDAEGIFFFVGPRVAIRLSLNINWNTIDWSILCFSRRTPYHYRPGPETKHSGYLRVLP